MKKLLLLLLASAMLCSVFILPASAVDYINYEVDVWNTSDAPKIDGEVKPNEYGRRIHRYSEDRSQFDCPDDHDEYDNWDFDFYITWDKNNLYMAWVVNSKIHHGLEEGTYDGAGNKTSDTWPDGDPTTMLGWMWRHSFVEFIITPSKPIYGSTSYINNHLEVGLGLLDDGTQARVIWSVPSGANTDDVHINDWNAAIVRDDSAQTTTYEVSIPWKYTGVSSVGNNAQFGLSYAVAAQEDYFVKKGMIEWQDAVLGGKEPDKAAVVTLVGNEDDTVIVEPDILIEGVVPSEAYGKTQIPIDGVDKSITAEKAYLCTDPTEFWNMNTRWTYNMLFEPVSARPNHYILVEAGQGQGEDYRFITDITDGMIALAVHSDGWDSSGEQRRQDAMSIGVGSEVVLFGVDVEQQDMFYNNAMLYVVWNTNGGFGDESVEESVEESVVEESKEESYVESEWVEEESKENDYNGNYGNSYGTDCDHYSYDSGIGTDYPDGTATAVESAGISLWVIIILVVVFAPLLIAGIVVLIVVLTKKSGNNVKPQPQIPPQPQAQNHVQYQQPAQAQARYCPKCGVAVNANDVFCNNCGNKLL